MKRVGLAALAFLVVSLSLLERRAFGTEYWPLQINGRFFDRLEIARTTSAHRRGLMNRKELPADGGMLFVFDREERRSFWMKNTLIPLDIVFLDAECKVISLHRMEVERPRRPNETEPQYDMMLTTYPSGAPAQFAIELNAGQISKCGIKVGETIDLRKDDLLMLLKGK